MANYKLTSDLREQIAKRASKLCATRIDYCAGDFPLTTAQLQYAVMPNEQIASLQRLRADGIQELPEHESVHLLLSRAYLPALARSCIIHLKLPEPIFAQRPTGYVGKPTDFSIHNPQALAPDWAGLSEEDRQELATWANNIIKASRHEQMVSATVVEVLKECLSIGHVLAVWPALASLVLDAQWKSRFRNGPRSLRGYAPRAHLVTRLSPQMKASEVVLSAAELLNDYIRQPNTILATLVSHEFLTNDRTF